MVGGSTRMPAVGRPGQEHHGQGAPQGRQPRTRSWPSAPPCRPASFKGDVKASCSSTSTPMSLGIETKGGVMTKLIEREHDHPDQAGPRSSPRPTTASRPSRSTCCQGEREWPSSTRPLGKFQLVDLPPTPHGVPQIEVTFDIDAQRHRPTWPPKDRATSKEQSMTITGPVLARPRTTSSRWSRTPRPTPRRTAARRRRPFVSIQ